MTSMQSINRLFYFNQSSVLFQDKTHNGGST